MAKIRSDLHTGQYTGSVPPDHSHGQALVEPLSLQSMGSPDMSISLFARQLKKGEVDLPCKPVVSIATQWLKVII